MTTSQHLITSAMLDSQSEWLLRRKLSIQILDEQWHRRALTVDFRLDESTVALARAAGITSVFVPISLPSKEPAQTLAYDLLCAGTSQHLPTLQERLEYTSGVLDAAIARHLRRQSFSEQLKDLGEAVASRSAVGLGPMRAARAIRQLRQLPDAAWHVGTAEPFIRLATVLVTRCLLVVERPVDAPQPVVAKLRYLASHKLEGAAPPPARASLEPYVFSLPLAAWQATSVHVEVDAPAGLEILNADLIGERFAGGPEMNRLATGRRRRPHRPGSTRGYVETFRASTRSEATQTVPGAQLLGSEVAAPRGSRTHLYRSRPAPADRLTLVVDFRVARSGFVSGAAWITAVIALVMLGLTAGLPTVGDEQHLDAAAALLLVFPAVGAAAVTQYGPHELTSSMLTTVRRAVYVSSMAALAGCIMLLTGLADLKVHSGHGGLCPAAAWAAARGPFLALCLISTWTAVLVFLARRLPSSTDVRRTHRFLRSLTRPLVAILSWPNVR